MRKFYLLFFWLLLFEGYVLHAQNDLSQIQFKNYDVTDGLSNNTVSDVFQDKYGFIWFATEDGLNRYDGYKFEIFNHDPNDSTSIGGNYCGASNSTFLQTSNHEFIVNVWYGLYDFYLYNYQIGFYPLIQKVDSAGYEKLALISDESNLRGNYDFLYDSIDQLVFVVDKLSNPRKIHKIINLNDVRKNRMYDGFNNYLIKINIEKRQVEFVHGFNSTIRRDIKVFYPKIIAAIKGAILSYDVINKDLDTLFGFDPSGTWPYSIDNEGKIWMKKDQANEETSLISFINDSISKIVNTANIDINDGFGISCILTVDSNQWLATHKHGVLVVNNSNELIHQFYPSDKKQDAIPGFGIRKVFEDSDKNIWVTSEQNGIGFYPRSSGKVKNISSGPGIQPLIYGDFVRGLHYDDAKNCLWVGTRDGGLTEIDLNSNTSTFHLQNLKGELRAESILAIDEHTIWLGTSYRGLYNGVFKYKPASRELSKIFSDTSTQENFYIRNIFRDSSGKIWITTMGDGLFYVDTVGLIHNVKLSKHTQDRSNDIIFRVIQNKSGDYLAATENGIVVFDAGVKIKKHYTTKGQAGKTLSNGVVFCMYEDNDDMLWAGTFGGGLNKINQHTGNIKSYNHSQGLCNDVIYGILPDDHGNLWLSTNNGLSCFNPHKETFRNFSTKDGLIYDAFSFGAYCKDKHGKMYFGTQKGISTFHPDSLLKTKPIHNIVIRKLLIHGSDRVYKFPDASETIQIDYLSENLFTLDFVCPEFVDQEKISYSYRIDGLHKDWINLGMQRQLVLSTLPFGRHIIRLKATKIPDEWNSSETNIPIFVKPPFWQTWYFRVMVLFILVFVFFLILLNRRRHARRVESIRTKLAYDLHDEIGSNISGINLIGQRLGWGEINQQQAHKFSGDIVALSQRTADSMRDIIWFMKPENDSPEKIRMRLIAFVNSVLEDLDLTLNIDDDFFKKDVPPATLRNVYLMVKEMVNNVAKHANAKSVLVQINRNVSFVDIKVKDDGIGIGESKKGNGMNSLRKRTSQMKGSISIITQPNQGTEINIQAKIKS